MRTALLGAVSHDLRSPLAAAKASVSCLRSRDIELTAADHDHFTARGTPGPPPPARKARAGRDRIGRHGDPDHDGARASHGAGVTVSAPQIWFRPRGRPKPGVSRGMD
jgi:hypothetical protein